MATVTKIAKALGLSDTTIRKYGKDYAEFLSPGANPGEGEKREYTAEDETVFNTISILRSQGKEHKAIVQALEAGTRLEPTEKPAGDESPPASEQTALITESFAKSLELYEARVSTYEADLKAEREARLAAEIRATAAEKEVEMLRQQQEEKNAEYKKLNWIQKAFYRG